jgi:hypothetical protein
MYEMIIIHVVRRRWVHTASQQTMRLLDLGQQALKALCIPRSVCQPPSLGSCQPTALLSKI